MTVVCQSSCLCTDRRSDGEASESAPMANGESHALLVRRYK
jgi:hypothetical protein